MRIRWLIGGCLAAEILFLLADYHVNYRRGIEASAIRRLADLTHRTSLASWFGVTQLLLIGLTLWVIYLFARQAGRPRQIVLGWLAVAIYVSFLVVDEGIHLHSAVGAAVDPTALGELKWVDAYPGATWQLLFLPLFAVGGGWTLLFLWRRLDSRASRRVLLVAAGCFVAATGLEILGSLDAGNRWNPFTWLAERFDLAAFTEERFWKSPYRTLRHFGEAAEEFLEMLGGTLLWWLLLDHAMRLAPRAGALFDGRRVRRFALSAIGGCVAIEILLLLFDYGLGHGPAASVEQVRDLFDITWEESLASWFGTAQTTLIALTLWALYAVSRRDESPVGIRRGWLALAIGFTYISADDGALIHERLGSAIRDAAGRGEDGS